MTAAAIIVAAGKGARFGGATPKQFLDLGGKPVLRWSLELFDAVPQITRIVVVCDPDYAGKIAGLTDGLATPVETVTGGETRTASVRAGLMALSSAAPDHVLIHDAARPGASKVLIKTLLDALNIHDGAAPALPLRDAVKENADGAPGHDIDRDAMMAVQTPQAFAYAKLVQAYAGLAEDEALSDDIAVARRHGLKVASVLGERGNIKITDPEDLEMMEAMLRGGPARIAVGQGYDVHRLIAGDGVVLCSVTIPSRFSLEGHSDADAGLHAICDAMLGTIGAGDIGQHFPPSDPQWKDADSAQMVTHCLALMAEAGARPAHCDVTLICESPKIGPHREAMQARVADLLQLPRMSVNIKATTTEKLGFTGRGEGLAAEAVLTAEIQGSRINV